MDYSPFLSEYRFSSTKVGEKLETELQFSEGAKEGQLA